MADGAYRWQGNWPAPDAARVAEIDAVWDVSKADAFGEPVRSAAVERMDRMLAATRVADPGEASTRLADIRSALAGLDPGALEPRRGLAGLFDSRGARLKRFRDAWSRAAAGMSETAAELSGRIDGAARRSVTLDGLWAEVRDTLADLDAHIAAASARLSDHPVSGDAPHPLVSRKAALDACRAAALQSLPLIRSAQNADARAAEALRVCTDGVAAWRDDWKAALGLAGKRPRSVRPDREGLARVRDDLIRRIDTALAELALSRSRLADVEARMAALRSRL